MILQSRLKRKTETIRPTSWFGNHNTPDVQSSAKTTYCRLLKTVYRSNSITFVLYRMVIDLRVPDVGFLLRHVFLSGGPNSFSGRIEECTWYENKYTACVSSA